MVIYGEYLFLENFITGSLIVYFTGKLAGRQARWVRLFASGLLCGFYAFSMFIPLSQPAAVLSKVCFAALAVGTAFGKQTLTELLLNGVVFFAVTFLYGGITIALLTGFSWKGITAMEGIYLPPGTYLTVMAAAAAAALMVLLIIDLIRVRRRVDRTRVSVRLQLGNRIWNMDGWIDSGNFLREPVTGKPVAVIRNSAMEEILNSCEDKTVRYVAIPYNSVGTEKGIMDGYRLDAMTAEGKTMKKPVLAVCRDEEFLTGKDDRGQILLPESMLERGIYADLRENQSMGSEIAENLRREYFLHRRKRRATAASKPRGRKTDAAGICGGESGSQSRFD